MVKKCRNLRVSTARALIVGCALLSCVPSDKNPLPSDVVVYRKDIILNGLEGVGVLPFQNQYELHMEARGSLDLVRADTCHRSWISEKAWNVVQTVSTWYGWKRKITKEREMDFIFKPTPIEFAGDCPLNIQAFEVGGIDSSGLFVFDNPSYQLKSYISCNGSTYKTSYGVSACQARVGTIQEIAFDEVVKVSKDNTCGIEIGEKKHFEFRLPLQECAAVFEGPSGQHVLFGWGYNKERVRQ